MGEEEDVVAHLEGFSLIWKATEFRWRGGHGSSNPLLLEVARKVYTRMKPAEQNNYKAERTNLLKKVITREPTG